jgi:tetratricopeptide (TPR) repeat protein
MEAALLRHSHDGIDPERAIDQLVRMSLVERSRNFENVDYLSVPLSAAIFGREKLEVAAARPAIIEDVRFVQALGSSDISTDTRGLLPRLERLFSEAAKRIDAGIATLQETRPTLEFLARGYSQAWLLLSRFERDARQDGWEERSAEYIRRYLQAEPNGLEANSAWRDLESLYRQMGDDVAACGAFLRMAEISPPPLERLSGVANWLNGSDQIRQSLTTDERASVFLPLAGLIEKHIREATPTDLSRLGWLYLNSGELARAKEIAEMGLAKDRDNIHCYRLLERVSQ